ncbi:MAG: replication protein [Desulfobacteraceae bacterium]|nr:replication protein [Desulfobacteraceae bacterium]
MYQDNLTGGISNSNFTQIPNALIDRLTQVNLSGQQSQIILAIIRKTFGFQKKQDWISSRLMSRLTGISHERAIKRSLRALEKNGIIEVDRTIPQKPAYKIKESFFISGGDNFVTGGGDKTVPEGVTISSPTKETKTKEKETTTEKNHQEKSSCCSLPENSKKKELSAEELEFIDLETERASKAGEIKTTKSRYRAGLKKIAMSDQLDISDLEKLRSEREKPKEPTSQDRERELAKELLEKFRNHSPDEIENVIFESRTQGTLIMDGYDNDQALKLLNRIFPGKLDQIQHKINLANLCKNKFIPASVRTQKLEKLRSVDPYLADQVELEMQGA